MQKNSVLLKQSRYVSGGLTEVNQNALEWWERAVYRTNTDDRNYVVEKKFEGRLDLIAAMFFGEPRMWWIIAMHNNILDPYNEIVEGTILYIPTKEKADGLLTGTIGGYPSQREVPLSIFPVV